MPLKKAVIAVVILFFAEVLASGLAWSGKPIDGTWEPSFWQFEASRLCYWVIFVSIIFAAVAFARYGLLRLKWMNGNRSVAVSCLVAAVCGALALGTEYFTSVFYFRSLPWNIASYVGWYRERYISDHLWSWVFSSCALLGAWFLWRRRRGWLVQRS